jgi:hypothetical protein
MAPMMCDTLAPTGMTKGADLMFDTFTRYCAAFVWLPTGVIEPTAGAAPPPLGCASG